MIGPALEKLADALTRGGVEPYVRALALLGPVIDDVAAWLAGKTEEPPYLVALPEQLRSRLTLERIRAQARRKGGKPR